MLAGSTPERQEKRFTFSFQAPITTQRKTLFSPIQVNDPDEVATAREMAKLVCHDEAPPQQETHRPELVFAFSTFKNAPSPTMPRPARPGRIPSPPRSAAGTPTDAEVDLEAIYCGNVDLMLTPKSRGSTGRNTPITPFHERIRIRPTNPRDPRLLEAVKDEQEKQHMHLLLRNWESLQKREEELPVYEFSSYGTKFLGMRAMLIAWICNVCVEFSFRRQTFHLAVNYLDLYFHHNDPTEVNPEDMTYIGTAMVDLAVRTEETDEDAIKDFEANSAALNGDDFLPKCGKFVSRLLENVAYDIHVPTAYDWLKLYAQLAAHLEATKPAFALGIHCDEGEDKCLWERKFEARQFMLALRYLDAIVHHVKSRRFPNSLLAAAMFYWKMAQGSKHHLELCTGYTRDQISDCFGWFEDEFQPLLLDDPNENHGLWSEAADDDDVVQKINPLDMNYVFRAWGLGDLEDEDM